MKRLEIRREALTALEDAALADVRGGTLTAGVTCYGCVTSTASNCPTDHCTWTFVCYVTEGILG